MHRIYFTLKFRSCIADDGSGNIIVLMLYNIKMDLIKPNDVVFVADAVVKTIKIDEVSTLLF